MNVFFVSLLVAAAGAARIQPRSLISYPLFSAASDSQIKFAVENKYDDTGPGAKKPETAFRTFKTLEEALVDFLDDPDTKLPEHERAKAEALLSTTASSLSGKYLNKMPLQRYIPKTVEEYTGFQKTETEKTTVSPAFRNKYVFPTNIDKIPFQFSNFADSKLSLLNLPSFSSSENLLENKLKLESRPLASISGPAKSYSESKLEEAHNQYHTKPKYSFSYGVHDQKTGDLKSAHEVRDGDVVRGFYSFIDPLGKTRTVHYTADSKDGFKANIESD